MQYNIEISGIDKVLANLTKLEAVIKSSIKMQNRLEEYREGIEKLGFKRNK